MDLGIKGRVALVAGGSLGLGRAVAEELSREGALVSICALDDGNLLPAAEEIMKETGGEVIALPVDLSKPKDAREFVKKSVAHYGTVDILFNNAGGPPSLPLEEIDDDLWKLGFQLNLMSTIAMTTEAIPIMKKKKWREKSCINTYETV